MAPRVFATRQLIQTNGLASGSSPITMAKEARVVMPQFFPPFNTKKKRTLLMRGVETTTPQATRASNSHVPRVHVHQENTQFFNDQLMECQLQMRETTQKLVNTSLFNFQDLKLSTKDIITVLKGTLNTTSCLLPILDPHVTGVPSNPLERHSIGSCVIDGVRNLVTNSLVDLLLSKGVVDNHSLHKISHSFLKVVPNEKTSIAIKVAIIDNTKSTI